MGSGVRLMAACLAISVLMGWHIAPVIVVFILISVAYMSLGGMRAVVWTNVIQALVFMVGGLATIAFLLHEIDGGISAIGQVAGAAGKLDVIKSGTFSSGRLWKGLMSDPNIWWLALLNGLFGSMAAFGTDQDLTQRLLTVETRRESQRTMALTIPTSLFVLLIHLLVGAGLYVFYRQNPGLPLPEKIDKIFPHFIGHPMPPVMRGLLLSAIVLASIDSPLASLATSFVTDLYKPSRPGLPTRLSTDFPVVRRRLRGDLGGTGLRLQLLRQDLVAGVQNRRRDVRVAARRLPSGPPDEALEQPRQRLVDGGERSADVRTLGPVGERHPSARMELARRAGHGPHVRRRVFLGSRAGRRGTPVALADDLEGIPRGHHAAGRGCTRAKRTRSPTGDTVNEKCSITSSTEPTRSRSKFRTRVASTTRISSSASDRPGQMRGPEPNGMLAPPMCASRRWLR